jgi:SAM-dependent methyltransferase
MLSRMRNVHRRLPLARRSSRRELLDLGCVARSELERNLGDLARLNRLPGGTAASVAAVNRLVGRTARARILDVGTGRGDIPLAFARRGWTVTGVEADAEVIAVARRTTNGARFVRIEPGDAASLPYDDDAFDVAHCSLLLHHLDPGPAISGLREMARVARRGVVVNDLRRGWLPLLATAAAVTVLGRCRTTRHDGLLSVLRAYRLDEIDELCRAAGLRVVARSPGWMPRVVTTAVATR